MGYLLVATTPLAIQTRHLFIVQTPKPQKENFARDYFHKISPSNINYG